MTRKSLKETRSKTLGHMQALNQKKTGLTAAGYNYYSALIRQARAILADVDLYTEQVGSKGYEHAVEEIAADILVVDYLASLGERRSTIALLEFTAAFSGKIEVAGFALSIMRAGYTYHGFVNETDPAYPYRVYFTRESLLTVERVCEKAIQVMGLVEKYAGVYEGWQTTYNDETGVTPAAEVLARMKKLHH